MSLSAGSTSQPRNRWYLVSMPVISHYWGSIFRQPVEFLPSGGARGHNSLERLKREYNIVVVIFVTIFFSSVLRIMDRVESSVLPLTSDPVGFKASFSNDFTMISVSAAILAQVAITALALPNLNQVHWTASAGFVISLVSGCMSVWVSTTVSRRLTSLDSPDAIRDWFSIPASKEARVEFEKNLKARLKTADLSTMEEVDRIRLSISSFWAENRWKISSFSSCTMLTAPSLLLNVSLPSFLLALGIYLGTVWKKNLDPVAGSVASRAVLICYVVSMIVTFTLFFGASNQKESETDFLRKWMDALETKEKVRVERTDVEAGGHSDAAVIVSEAASRGQTDEEGKDEPAEGIRALDSHN